ncbi:MAG: UbiD family decarboxylase [Woeseiaceae bacterium]|nr:UbiD family decarboxylase [Woeseiaceae bacterium]
MQTYLEQLKKAGQLVNIDKQVDPQFELAAVTRAMQKHTDNAVLFENVRGTKFPVVTNLYSSPARFDALIDSGDKGFCARFNELTDELGEADGSETHAGKPPKGLVDSTLGELPLITYHAQDAGPYFTSAIYLAKDPETGVPNLSFHRSMYVSDSELRVRLGESHNLAAYFRKAEARNEPLEAALLIGLAPELFLAACASIPEQSSEYALAARLAGQAVATYAARSIDLEIPASAQVVVEGKFLPGLRRPEGPFGEVLGYYVPQGDNAVFEISDVYCHPNAVFHSILCGSDEDRLPLGRLIAAKTYRHLANLLPGIIDVTCHPIFMNTTIRMRPEFEDHAKQALLAAFDADSDYHQLCIAIDEDDDPQDVEEILMSIVTRGRLDERTIVIPDRPGFYRDPHRDFWGRLGIDATRPFGREADFVKKTIPGQDDIDLDDYL